MEIAIMCKTQLRYVASVMGRDGLGMVRGIKVAGDAIILDAVINVAKQERPELSSVVK
jgi:hypothetical protein